MPIGTPVLLALGADIPYTLVLAVLFSLLTSTMYAYIGSLLIGRQVSPQARLASVLFATWWFGLAGVGFISATLNIAAIAGYTDLNLWMTLGMFNLLVILLALWALLYYLIYLYTGSRRALVPLSAFYLVVYVFFLYLVNVKQPLYVEVGRWNAQLKYAQEFNEAVGLAAIILLLVPQFLAAIAYFSLFFRATDRTQRYRIAMVSGSIIVWFGVSLGVSFAGSGSYQSDAWQIISRVLSLLAPLAILFAYRPPKAWRKKYQLRGLGEEAPAEVPVAAASA